MPYKSDAQRKFFHTDTAKKAGITSSDVQEFDKASKGMKLPEHVKKMADGGAVVPSTGTVNAPPTKPTLGDSGVLQWILQHINPQAPILKDRNETQQGIDVMNQMAEGGEVEKDEKPHIDIDIITPSTGTPSGIGDLGVIQSKADGGDVSPYPTQDTGVEGLPITPQDMSSTQLTPQQIVASLQQGLQNNAPANLSVPGSVHPNAAIPPMPPKPQAQPMTDRGMLDINSPAGQNAVTSTLGAPDLSALLQKLQQTPNTPSDMYGGISAADRAAQAKQLALTQGSTPNLLASGAAGLGDAIARSFGGQNTDFQKTVRGQNEAMQQKALGITDVQRQQALQDYQLKVEQEGNDANSELSKGAQDLIKQMTGQTTTAPFNVLTKLVPGLGELAYKQAMLGNAQATREQNATSILLKEGPIAGFLKSILQPAQYNQMMKLAGLPITPAPAATAPANPSGFKYIGPAGK